MPLRIISTNPNYQYTKYVFDNPVLVPEHINPKTGLKERVVQFDADDNTHPPIIVQRKIQKKPKVMQPRATRKQGRYTEYSYRGVPYLVEQDTDRQVYEDLAQKQRDIISNYHHNFRVERNDLKPYNTFKRAFIVIPTNKAKEITRQGGWGPFKATVVDSNNLTTRFEIVSYIGEDFTPLKVFKVFNSLGIQKLDAPRLRYVNQELKKQYEADQAEQAAMKFEDAQRIKRGYEPIHTYKIRREW